MVAAENGVKMAAEDVGSPRGVKRGVVEKADASENTGLKCGMVAAHAPHASRNAAIRSTQLQLRNRNRWHSKLTKWPR